MNKSTDTNNAKNDRTKERILDEAEALFALKGYHAVSVREITGTANCSRGPCASRNAFRILKTPTVL
jgi:AcrR family transcriptional regulator